MDELEDLSKVTLKNVAKPARHEAKPVANTTLSAGYRKRMVEVLIKRAVARAMKEGNG